MYLPKSFKVENLAAIHGFIKGAGLATLVTQGAAGPQASHLPLLLDPDQGESRARTISGAAAHRTMHWRSS